VRRDAVTLAAYVSLSTYTWFIYGLSPTIPLVREEFGTTSAIAGLHSLMLAFGVIIGASVGVPVMRRWHRYGAASGGSLTMAAAVAAFIAGSLLPAGQLAVTLPSMVVAGVGGALLINSSTAVLNDHNGALGTAAVSEANAVAATVGLVSPLAVGLVTGLGWSWRPALALTIPLAAFTAILVLRRRQDAAYAATPPGRARFSARGLTSACWLAIFGVVSAVAIEFCAVTWTPDLLTGQAGMAAGAATAGVAAVVGGMAAGRFVIARFAARYPAPPLFVISVAVTVAGWLLLWTSTAPAPAVAGLLIVGLGVAGQFPLGISMVMGYARGETDRAVAVASVGLGLAAGTGPFVLGALADVFGVRGAFLVVPVFCGCAALFVALASRSNRRAAVDPAA
jgi:MFS family permease